MVLLVCLVTDSLSVKLLPYLLGCVLALAAANGVFLFLCRRRVNPYRLIVLQVVIDLMLLTALLHFSGGIENPLFALYALHVIIAGILLRRATAFSLTALSCALLALLGIAELRHWLPHYTFKLFPHGGDGGIITHASHEPTFVAGQVMSFSVVLFLTAYLTALISERLRQSEKHLERAAAEAHIARRRLESVVEAVGAGLILVSNDLHVLWFNQRMRDWFGLTDEYLGISCSSSGWCESAAGEAIYRAACQTRTPHSRHEEFAVELNGGRHYFSITTAPLFDEQGAVVQHAELVQDITGRKVAEAQMLHAAKMAALGTLAAGITHEIGNPLSSLSTRLRLLENRREPAFVGESVRHLKSQIDRIQRIVQGVSQFGRPGSEEWLLCDVSRILEEVLGLLRLDRRAKRVDLKLETSARPPLVMGVKDQLVQVFLNLGINALEAMAEKGWLSFRSTSDGRTVRVSVEDSGPGISEVVRDKLFSPFFSTKKDGAGLGLSISASIVNAHGGQIQVESPPGCGAIFTVTLPSGQGGPRGHLPTGIRDDA